MAPNTARDGRSTGIPFVTIGLPVWNGERGLARALDSLLGQTHRDFVIVISDNGSTDGTAAICARYAERDPRIEVHRHAENMGSKRNFDFVLSKARGDYFMFAAHDDWWAPTFVEAMVEKLEPNPSLVVCLSAVRRVDSARSTVDVVRFDGDRSPEAKSPLALAIEIASVRSKLNFYIYGVYRTEFLSKAFRVPQGFASDRLFVLCTSLAGGVGYVDTVLIERSINPIPLDVRYRGEALGRAWSDPLAWTRYVLAVPRAVLSSPVVPLRRKLLAPLLMCAALWSKKREVVAGVLRFSSAIAPKSWRLRSR